MEEEIRRVGWRRRRRTEGSLGKMNEDESDEEKRSCRRKRRS